MMLGWNVARWVGKVKHRAAIHADTSSQSRRSELEYAKARNGPSGLGPRSKSRGRQHVRKSKSEEDTSSHWIYLSVRICVMLAVSIIVLYFQIKNRPNEINIYRTSDPHNTSLGGVNYTCGCNLPPSMQYLEDFKQTTVEQDNLNICYDVSSLESVNIVLYSDSAADQVKTITPEEPRTKTVSGYKVYQQAHDIHGPINDYSETSTGVISEAGSRLYLGGYRQPDKQVSLRWLESVDFIGFPPAYLRLAFTYGCEDCSLCSLEKVNEIFKTVSGGEENRWGSCFYYDLDNHCDNHTDPFYEAKCTLYPTNSLPANFAVQQFLKSFLKLPAIGWVAPAPLNGSVSIGLTSTSSFQPSTVYLNVSRVVSSQVNISFLEVEWGSALWLSLYKTFPTLGSNCSALGPISLYNASSLCNVFATSKKQSYDLRCIHRAEITELYCQQLMANSSVDNVHTLFQELGIMFPDGATPIEYYTYLACHELSNVTVAPYLATWDISSNMKDDSLSVFLRSEILKKEWSRCSGVCINTFKNVIRQNTDDGSITLSFWETDCSSHYHKNGTQVHANVYCWLTGRYRNFTDTPEDRWKNGKLQFSNSRDGPSFVCYRVQPQHIFAWFTTMIGILFGWVGTCFSLFRAAEWTLRWIKTTHDQRGKEEQEMEIEQLEKETSNASLSNVE